MPLVAGTLGPDEIEALGPKVRLWREFAAPRGRCSRRFGTFEDLTAESE
jgi:hypothetical protein